MSDPETAHCRLCAYSKPYNKLINLQTDEEKRHKLLEKLSRLHIEVPNIDSNEDLLPKTVCFTCIEALDNAFNFVLHVETAQGELNEIISQNVKQETEIESFETFEDTYDDTTVKIEDLVTNNESDQSKNELNNNVCKKHKKNSAESTKNIVPDEKPTWKDYNWTCAYCETIFPTVDELINHSMEIHGCCNAYKCADCNLRKLKLDNFIVHVKRHRQYLKRSCFKCHMVFPRTYDSIVHKTTHLNSEYKCPGCNSTYPSLAELTEHSETYNKDKKSRGVPAVEIDDDHTCVFCKKTFKYKGSLTTHLLTHTDRKRNHICDKCGKSFLSKNNLDGHMMLHDDSRPHQCEICKLAFRTRYGLRTHIGVHDGAKPYTCDQCGRCFRLKKQLESHTIIHTDSLPYVCNICQKSFRFKTILNQHLRQHTGVKPYSCQICQRDFTNWPNYNKHMKRRHSMDMAKKKHTPEGLFPVNPTTGEIIIEPQSNKTLEWKKKVLDAPNRPGRPRVSAKKTSNITLTLLSNGKVKSQDGRYNNNALKIKMSQLFYCRFCAQQKPLNELIDFTTNTETREVILEKMTSCNISCVDFSNKNLSETVCASCLSTLDVLSEFVNKVKSSQVILSDLSKIYKSEYDMISMPDYGDNYCEFDDENTSQKEENLASNLKLDVEVSVESVESNFCGNSVDFNSTILESIANVEIVKNISWSSYPWSCAHCNMSLDSMAAVRHHSRKIHGVCNGFQCADCGSVQTEFKSFVDHVLEHRDGLKHFCEHCNIKLESSENTHKHSNTCSNCGEIFSDEEHLNKHIKKYQNKTNVTEKISKKKMTALKELLSYGVEIFDSKCFETWRDYPWVCRYCNTKFPDQNVLRNHVKEVHGKCFGFKCVDCAKSCESFEGFVEHVRGHRPNLMYYCQYCNCRLEDTQTDIIHISDHLANDPLCPTCGHIFKDETDLQKHVSVYNPPKLKRPFRRRERPITVDDLTCNICQKVSKSVTILRAHKKLHTDRRRDYTCDRCGMAFFTKGALSNHKIIHEKPDPQICLICKKSFLTLTRLRKHLKTHNGIKPFQCPECQRSFRLKEQLKGHLITHTDLLPYQCQYCEKAFKHKNVLKIHENQHTGARPYSCLICKMDFANWSNCNKHMKRKHGSTLAKNKMTSQGKLPINPKTGKPRPLRDFDAVKEWAEQILETSKRGKKSG
ncbi:uncharacterized protein [Epargyreus clarus]|uniref:uncharacterized protein n=1 Tax=Epargyreus clarus TaxID=520877 RepID=UPI003C2B7A96